MRRGTTGSHDGGLGARKGRGPIVAAMTVHPQKPDRNLQEKAEQGDTAKESKVEMETDTDAR